MSGRLRGGQLGSEGGVGWWSGPQIAATKTELKKTEAAIERYVHAFESGTVSDDMFGPRVRELGDRAGTLQARHNELTEAAIAAAADPPTQADLDALRAELDDMICHGSDTHRKAIAQTFVKRLLVQEPGVIQPTLLVRGGLPAEITGDTEKTAPNGASRAVTTVVEARGLEPPDLLTASQALYQLSYAPGCESRAYQPSEGRDVPPPVP